jgi:hypothetical protein
MSYTGWGKAFQELPSSLNFILPSCSGLGVRASNSFNCYVTRARSSQLTLFNVFNSMFSLVSKGLFETYTDNWLWLNFSWNIFHFSILSNSNSFLVRLFLAFRSAKTRSVARAGDDLSPILAAAACKSIALSRPYSEIPSSIATVPRTKTTE